MQTRFVVELYKTKVTEVGTVSFRISVVNWVISLLLPTTKHAQTLQKNSQRSAVQFAYFGCHFSQFWPIAPGWPDAVQ